MLSSDSQCLHSEPAGLRSQNQDRYKFPLKISRNFLPVEAFPQRNGSEERVIWFLHPEI